MLLLCLIIEVKAVLTDLTGISESLHSLETLIDWKLAVMVIWLTGISSRLHSLETLIDWKLPI